MKNLIFDRSGDPAISGELLRMKNGRTLTLALNFGFYFAFASIFVILASSFSGQLRAEAGALTIHLKPTNRHHDAKDTARPIKIVAFGDSLTVGTGLGITDAFPAQLEIALRARGVDVVVENAGVAGDTTSGGVERLEWSIPDDTDAVIFELGANDALRGIDPRYTRANLNQALAYLRKRRLPVLLCGMRAPPNMGSDFTRAFDPIFKEIADQHRVLLYPFFLEGVAADPKLNLSDGMHPNAGGVAVIVRNILPFVEKLISRIEPSVN